MKVEITEKNQLKVTTENKYEALALNAWYDNFHEQICSDGYRSMPMLSDHRTPSLLVELFGIKSEQD